MIPATACPQCHEFRLPHRVCPSCGHYNGAVVVEMKKK
jgi:large subunit ribosomal protein L32